MTDFSKVWKIGDIDWKYLSYGKVVTALRISEIISKHFDFSDTVFDLGCGAGGLSQFLDHYVGLDLVWGALLIAENTKNPRDSRFVCGQSDLLPFKNRIADIVLSINMLEHTEDPEAGIREIFRICKKGGVIIIPCRDTFGICYDPINYTRKMMGLKPIARGAFGFGHINVLSKSEWMEIICKCGFTIESIEPYDDSLVGQIEFFLFSLLMPKTDHEDIPLKTISGKNFKWIALVHKIISILDIKMKSSFSQAFVVSKIIS